MHLLLLLNRWAEHEGDAMRPISSWIAFHYQHASSGISKRSFSSRKCRIGLFFRLVG